MTFRVLLLVLTMLLASARVDAQWLPGGNRVGDGAHNDARFFMTASGPDRVVVAWTRELSPSDREIRAQAWTADGSLVPGWTEAGVLVSDFTHETWTVSVCEDGAGGAFVGWSATNPSDDNDLSIRLQHLSADGSRVAGWPADGLSIRATERYSGAVVTPDGAGGVFVGRTNRIQWNDYRSILYRITSTGASAPGWPAEGVMVAGASPQMLGDADHVFVATTEVTAARGLTSDTRVRRFLGNAAPDSAWPTGGVLLNSTYARLLFPDGSGGVYVDRREAVPDYCWAPVCPPIRRLARILGDGTPDPRWGQGHAAYAFAPDGMGGVLLGVIVDGGRPAVLRLDAGGAPLSGWEPPGNRAMTEVVAPRAIAVAGDGQGGAFTTWWDARTGRGESYSSRLDSNGQLATGWPATGSFAARPGAGPAELVTLGAGLVVALWDEYQDTGRAGYLSALRPGEPGALAELGPVPEDVGFGIVQMGPNPTNGPISLIAELRDEGPAHLELIDASGRVLESRKFEFSSQARGIVHLNPEGRLTPGIYWVHLMQGARRTSRKLVVLQ